MDVQVVEIQKVYNEFCCGVADPVAERWMIKMLYDLAIGDLSLTPKYVGLCGDGTSGPLIRWEHYTY